MEEKIELQYGPLARSVYERMVEIIAQLTEKFPDTVDTNVTIPDNFVELSGNCAQESASKFHVNTESLVDSGLSAALTAVLTSLASALNSPAAVIILLSATGSATSSYIQNVRKARRTQDEKLKIEQTDLKKLSSEDVGVHITINNDKRGELTSEAFLKIEHLCKEISDYENKIQDIHDVAVDKQFGEWIQRYFVYASGHTDDMQLQNLKYELINCLANMKIRVYDELLLNEKGEPDVPIADYIIDNRTSDSYEQIKKPAVYSNKMILARGEIQ